MGTTGWALPGNLHSLIVQIYFRSYVSHRTRSGSSGSVDGSGALSWPLLQSIRSSVGGKSHRRVHEGPLTRDLFFFSFFSFEKSSLGVGILPVFEWGGVTRDHSGP